LQINNDNINELRTSELQDRELTFRDYFFIIKFHSIKVLFFTVSGLMISIYSILTIPPSYTATATVAIREKPGAGVIMDLTGDRDRNRMYNEIQLIRSRSVAKKTIEIIWPYKKNNLALFDSYPFYPRGRRVRTMLKELFTLGLYNPESQAPISYKEGYSENIGERFAGKLLQNLSANHRNGTDIIDVSYTSVWPDESKLIVNTLADVYKNFEVKMSGEYAANSVEFLETLLTEQDKKLRESEREFTNYKKQERMYDIDGLAMGISEQVTSIESEIYNTDSEINIRIGKYNLLKSKLSQDEKILAERLLNDINIQVLSLRTEIGKLESQLVQNVAQHGEDHDVVIDLRLKLKGLKKQLNMKVQDLTAMGIMVQDPLQSRQNIVTELITLDSEITALKLKMTESEKLLNVYKSKLNDLPEKQLEFFKLQRNSTILSENYSLIRKKLEEAKINLAVQVGKVQIVDYARLPGKSSQNKNRIIIMGIIFGLGSGIAIAFGLEFLDNTIKTSFDVEKKNMPVLGIIPSIGEEQEYNSKLFFKGRVSHKSSRTLKRRLITREDPRSPVSEAYRSLRTSMLFTSPDDKVKSILVSSAGPGEGKTTTVANLAITYANLGKKTLLVDTDLRRPVIHKVLDLKKEPGITDYLSGTISDFSTIIQETEIENLSAVSSGIIPPNPSELLGSKKMLELIKNLEIEWDMILFDSPPLVAVTDATMVSKEIDRIIMVVKVGQTDKKAFDHTITSLRNVNAPLGGVILNAVTHKNSYGSYYYYYQYYHYYGSEKEPKNV
tara:strand:+ start:729 stop:3077 length:2349 start_codon:yes stop_codon:yes gene_type:complete